MLITTGIIIGCAASAAAGIGTILSWMRMLKSRWIVQAENTIAQRDNTDAVRSLTAEVRSLTGISAQHEYRLGRLENKAR